MTPTGHRILFMGTPTFAVGSLDALVSAGFNVVAVVTAPDRPAGRGRQPRPSAVKLRALELEIPVLQPERLKDPEFLAELDRIAASLYIVVAFRMLPEVVWSRPALGTVNLHASLLPDYRGAAPINWAIMNGEQQTGVTTFLIGNTIDTGDILLQEGSSIGQDETAGELHDRLMVIGAGLLVRTVQGLFAGTLQSRPQHHRSDHHDAPKLAPATARLGFDRNARSVHDHVRGLSPIPGAWCTWTESAGPSMHFKILRTRLPGDSDLPPTGKAGSIRIDGHRLLIACADGWIEALEVQPEGKRRMPASDLIRGIRAKEGIMLT